MQPFTPPPPDPDSQAGAGAPATPIRDLAVYLAAGFGLYLLASLVLAQVFREVTGLVSALVYALNFACLTGTVYLFGIRRGKLSWSGLGLRPPRWRWSWLFLIAGAALALIPVRILIGAASQLLIEGGAQSLQERSQLLMAGGLTWPSFLVSLAGAGLVVPFSEELFFRGALHTTIRSRWPLWPAVLASSLLFGLAHFDSPGVAVSSFILGVASALVYEFTRSVWASFALHAVNNSAAVLLLYAALLATNLLRAAPSP